MQVAPIIFAHHDVDPQMLGRQDVQHALGPFKDDDIAALQYLMYAKSLGFARFR